MGNNRSEHVGGGLAGALFTPVQQKVLGLLFGQPERQFGSGEIIELANSGTGAAHRQLQRLAEVELVTVTRIGNQKHYQANSKSPIYEELRGVVMKTIGLVEPLRAALASIAMNIQVAFVFGSLAKGTERAGSDVDLLVVSDLLSYADLYGVLPSAEKALARPINPTVMTAAEWQRKRTGRDSFARRIAEQPKLFVVGDENALG